MAKAKVGRPRGITNAMRVVQRLPATREALRAECRERFGRTLEGIESLATDPLVAPMVRIRAAELLARYGVGERSESESVSTSLVMVVAAKRGDAGWPSMIDVEGDSGAVAARLRALPAPAESPADPTDDLASDAAMADLAGDDLADDTASGDDAD